MEAVDIRNVILDTLRVAAPGTDLTLIRPDDRLRGQLELDSLDWVNVLNALEERLDLRIPESDYHLLGTLDQLVAYFEAQRERKRSI